MKQTAILVNQGLPLIIDNISICQRKERQFVAQLNLKLEQLALNWQVKLDDSFGDIRVIEQQQPKALILKNGLQMRFNRGNFPKANIYQLGALELNASEINGVITFLKNRVQ